MDPHLHPIVLVEQFQIKGRHIAQQTQSFQPHYIGEEFLIDTAVGRLDIVAACDAIGEQRATSATPVAPGATLTPLSLLYREILNAYLCSLDHLQRVSSCNRRHRLMLADVTLRYAAMLIDDKIIYPHAATILVRRL